MDQIRRSSRASNMISNSEPVIKILKRPPNLVSSEQVNGLSSNCSVKSPPVVKSLQQREMEYAEARLRIFGTNETEEKLKNCKNQLNDVPKKIIKPVRKDSVIRHPRGPDGTKGFNWSRENCTITVPLDQDSDQQILVTNGVQNGNS